MLEVVEYEQDDIERMRARMRFRGSKSSMFYHAASWDDRTGRIFLNEINAIVDDDCFRDTLEHLVV